mmetsp:Transcript_10953/g.19164  ORF Transcript_10953/g.19164 Transcript_10953/m.19164 type:complete len:331 (-) Transcript_10953:496-1488(-)
MPEFLSYGGYFSAAFYAASGGVFLALFHRERSSQQRLLVLLDLVICLACMYTGILQGSGLGISRDKLGLEYNWARYLEWSITNPCMLTIISRMSEAPLDNNFISIAFSIGMVACGAGGQLMDDSIAIWIFFMAGLLCLSVIMIEILLNVRRVNAAKPKNYQRVNILIGCTTVSWVLYPSTWALQFSGAIPVRNEVFLLMNLIIKGVFSSILAVDTFRHRKEIFCVLSNDIDAPTRVESKHGTPSPSMLDITRIKHSGDNMATGKRRFLFASEVKVEPRFVEEDENSPGPFMCRGLPRGLSSNRKPHSRPEEPCREGPSLMKPGANPSEGN